MWSGVVLVVPCGRGYYGCMTKGLSRTGTALLLSVTPVQQCHNIGSRIKVPVDSVELRLSQLRQEEHNIGTRSGVEKVFLPRNLTAFILMSERARIGHQR